MFSNYDVNNTGLCKGTLVTWWENQSRGWWCLSQILRPHSLLWYLHGQCHGPDWYVSSNNFIENWDTLWEEIQLENTSVLMFKSWTSTLKYLRSVKDCPVVLCIRHCWVVLDLLKSAKKANYPQTGQQASPVPGPLFTGEVGNEMVDSVLDSLLSSTITKLRSKCIRPPGSMCMTPLSKLGLLTWMSPQSCETAGGCRPLASTGRSQACWGCKQEWLHFQVVALSRRSSWGSPVKPELQSIHRTKSLWNH